MAKESNSVVNEQEIFEKKVLIEQMEKEKFVICDMCGCANSEKTAICKMCSNYLKGVL